jgi:uncharacterized protein YlxW (UPF0749 family)
MNTSSFFKLITFAVSLVVGLLILVQQRSIQKHHVFQPSRVESIISQVKELEKENTKLRTSLTLKQSTTERSIGKKDGIEIMINDSSKPLLRGENPNLSIIHDEDLLKIVNELKAAGAVAVSLNEQRLRECSAISCAGPTILVNNSRLTPPFIIKAQGNSPTLERAMLLRGGIIDSLKLYGIEVQLQQRSDIVLPPLVIKNRYKLAQIVAEK